MEPCNNSSFGIDKLKNHFKVDFSKLYCIKGSDEEVEKLEIGGDSDDVYYSYIKFQINKCTGRKDCI